MVTVVTVAWRARASRWCHLLATALVAMRTALLVRVPGTKLRPLIHLVLPGLASLVRSRSERQRRAMEALRLRDDEAEATVRNLLGFDPEEVMESLAGLISVEATSLRQAGLALSWILPLAIPYLLTRTTQTPRAGVHDDGVSPTNSRAVAEHGPPTTPDRPPAHHMVTQESPTEVYAMLAEVQAPVPVSSHHSPADIRAQALEAAAARADAVAAAAASAAAAAEAAAAEAAAKAAHAAEKAAAASAFARRIAMRTSRPTTLRRGLDGPATDMARDRGDRALLSAIAATPSTKSESSPLPITTWITTAPPSIPPSPPGSAASSFIDSSVPSSSPLPFERLTTQTATAMENGTRVNRRVIERRSVNAAHGTMGGHWAVTLRDESRARQHREAQRRRPAWH